VQQLIKTHLPILLLLAFTFVVFYPSINCEFTNWDDDWFILDNPLIRSLSLSNLKELFSSYYVLNYQPLTLLSFAIEYYFFQLNPQVFHFTNVLFHLLNVLLVFKFVQLISSDNSSDKKLSFIALVTAALFALHPMRVESVTWVSERKDVLYAFFFLLSIIQYVKYSQRIEDNSNGMKNYYLALFFFVLSCLAKGMAVSLSLVLLLIDYLLKRKFNRAVFLDKVPFFVISILFGLLAVFATHNEEQVLSYDLYSFGERLQFAGYGFFLYLYKLILPINLSALYPYPNFASGSFPFYYWIYLIGSIAITCIVIYFAYRLNSRKIIFGFGLFVLTIIMVLQLMPVNIGIAADRYTYLPYLGLFYLVGEGCNFAGRKFGFINKSQFQLSSFKNVLLPAVIILLLFVLAFLTHNRIKIWQNSISLTTDMINKYPNEYRVYFKRAEAKYKLNDSKGAIADYDMVIDLNPDHERAYNNRANAKHKLNDYRGALIDYDKALELKPDYANAYNGRGTLNFDLGKFKNAIVDYNEAILANPSFAQAYLNRGNVYAAANNFDQAKIDIDKSLKLNPNNPEALLMRGNTSVALQDYKEAVKYYDLALSLNPDNPEAYFNRGSCKYYLQDLQGACNDWNVALGLGHAPAGKLIQQVCK